MDREVAQAEVADPVAARVDGYPYLRVTRFLASFRDEPLEGRAFDAWIDRMRDEARVARAAELANLNADARGRLARHAGLTESTPSALGRRTAHCGEHLRDRELALPLARTRLRRTARVPDDYVSWQRVAGLYPLTSLAVAAGIARWHRETESAFARPLESLPVAGRLITYAPAPPPPGRQGIAATLRASRANPLGIPELGPDDARTLLAAYAPVLQIDTATDDDRIGAPGLTARGEARVDPGHPAVYGYLSHTRLGGRILLQLSYAAWLPARPRTGPLDLLGGHIDGITWRVTLDDDGTPLVADAIHNCGCYHLFFPSAAVALHDRSGEWEERAFVPQALPALRAGERHLLRVAHRTHHLQRVLTIGDPGPRAVRYRLAGYDTLRSLPLPGGGRHGLFRPDGLVPGTERAERLLLWPMGVPEPGAMRARGRHATAFVGRRHFDDPWLLERAFTPGSPRPRP